MKKRGEYGVFYDIFGLIFILLDVHLGTINILPNIIGFIFLLLGTKELSKHLQVNDFSKAKKYIWFLIILSILDMIVQREGSIQTLALSSGTMEGIVYNVVFFLLHSISLLAYFYHLCSGIKKESEKMKNTELQKKSSKVFLVLSVYHIVFTMFGLFFQKNQIINVDSNFILILAILVFLFVWIYVFVQTYKLLSTAHNVLKQA